MRKKISKELKFSESNQKKKRKKKNWTQEEDTLLLQLIKKHGPKKWSIISKSISNREGKQCRERWYNHLNPEISKTPWTEKEEWILFLLFKLYGSKWCIFAKTIQGRTDNSIKNHWNSIMRRKLQKYKKQLNEILKSKDKEDDVKNTEELSQNLIEEIRKKNYTKQKIKHESEKENKESFKPVNKQEEQPVIVEFNLNQNGSPISQKELPKPQTNLPYPSIQCFDEISKTPMNLKNSNKFMVSTKEISVRDFLKISNFSQDKNCNSINQNSQIFIDQQKKFTKEVLESFSNLKEKRFNSFLKFPESLKSIGNNIFNQI